jgi:hypothetical protein
LLLPDFQEVPIMKKTTGFLSILGLLLLATVTTASAQDSPGKDQGGSATIQGKAGDGGVDIRVQGKSEQKDRNDPAPAAPQGPAGVPGPQGAPGPQGPTGPAGGTQVLGMDPTIALLVGLAVLAVVIVAIVAASRGRDTH